MCKQRVVITGVGAISPYGQGVECLLAGLHSKTNALQSMELNLPLGINCKVVGYVPTLQIKSIPREIRRTMSNLSIFAYLASQEALHMAQLDSGNGVGVAIGSTVGSVQTLQSIFTDFITTNSVENLRSMDFFKIMNHSAASNVALALQCTGRMLSSSGACASGLVNIGLAYEAIAAGHETCMLCGGADEFHILTSATFDRLGAATPESNPAQASRPFDSQRKGIVCSEGAGILCLESLESAKQRGVPILGEVLSFATKSAPSSLVFPDSQVIAACMVQALELAHLKTQDIDYLNAHATATKQGDVAEGQAIAKLFGTKVPVSSLKGHLGHTMAASGALELIVCLGMLQHQVLFPSLNLTQPDPECGQLWHVQNLTPYNSAKILKNSFGLGSCYASIIITSFVE